MGFSGSVASQCRLTCKPQVSVKDPISKTKWKAAEAWHPVFTSGLHMNKQRCTCSGTHKTHRHIGTDTLTCTNTRTHGSIIHNSKRLCFKYSSSLNIILIF